MQQLELARGGANRVDERESRGGLDDGGDAERDRHRFVGAVGDVGGHLRRHVPGDVHPGLAAIRIEADRDDRSVVGRQAPDRRQRERGHDQLRDGGLDGDPVLGVGLR